MCRWLDFGVWLMRTTLDLTTRVRLEQQPERGSLYILQEIPPHYHPMQTYRSHTFYPLQGVGDFL